MAQGDKWQLGVGYPLPNRSFEAPLLLGLTLNGAVTTGSTLTVDGITSPITLDKAVKKGDLLGVGPSTHSNNPGASEWGIVEAVTTTTLQIYGAFDYDYADEDPVSVRATNWPGAWKVDTATLYNNVSIEPGYADQYALEFDWADLGGVDGKLYIGTTNSTNRDSELPDLLPSTNFLFGCMYKGTVTGTSRNPRLRMQWYDQTPTLNTALGNVFSTQSNWTWTSAINGTGSAILSRTLSVQLHSTVTAVGAVASNFRVDEVTICHAKNTSTQTSGVITLPEDPDFVSVGYAPRLPSRDLIAGVTRYRQPLHMDGQSAQKYVVSANFTNLSQTFMNDLKILFDWQRKGWPLVLFPYIDDLPYAMYGYLEPPVFQKMHWDLAQGACTLNFVEM